MNCVHVGRPCDTQDVRNIEVGFNGPATLTHEVGLVGLRSMKRESVLVRINSDCAQAELGRGPHDTNGDLTAVGD
jgi:hypothetical protein